MQPDFYYMIVGLIMLAVGLFAGWFCHFLTRRNLHGLKVLWGLLIVIGAAVFFVGSTATGHMAGLGQFVFLAVIWLPAVVGAALGTGLAWRDRARG